VGQSRRVAAMTPCKRIRWTKPAAHMLPFKVAFVSIAIFGSILTVLTQKYR
jgi:hypothetical protein